MPEISIIVPVYKAERYLNSCVDSILSQTFSDMEVFLVDDGSPDNSGAICDEYARRDDRIRVIHQENQGQSAARNHALEQANGEWICFVDSDDLIHPQMVQMLYSAARKSGSGISMCAMAQGQQLPEDFLHPAEESFETIVMDDENLCRLFDGDAYPAWVACAKLIRRELIEAHPFCRGRVYEDNEAVCHWVCGAGQIARLSRELYFYRTNPQSTTQVAFSMKKLDYLWALEQITRFYSGLGFSGMRARFAQLYTEEIVNCCAGARWNLGSRKTAAQIVRRGCRYLREAELEMPLSRKEELLDIFHPRLIRLYWPVKGVLLTLRQEGTAGVARKLGKLLKGDMSE